MELDHPYVPSPNPKETRAPCPALNALANHGYLPHSGKDIGLRTLLTAIVSVYNFSYPVALLLAIPAFLRYGKFNTHSSGMPWNWGITIDLASLATFGTLRIAHQASLVHPNIPSHTPDKALLRNVISHAHREPHNPEPGLNLQDFAELRVERERKLTKPLGRLHQRIAVGESALTYLSLSGSMNIVPISRISQWFGEERLPDNWWQEVRPARQVGLGDVKRTGDEVREIMEAFRSDPRK